MYNGAQIRFAAAVIGLAVVGGGVVAATPAGAAQSTMPITCGGQQLLVRTNNNNSSDHGGWGAAIVVDGGSGHLIPTSFSGTLVDETTGTTVFSFAQSKGNGNANNSQQAVSCTSIVQDTLGDFAGPGEQLPPGTSPTDQVTFTINVTAVPKT